MKKVLAILCGLTLSLTAQEVADPPKPDPKQQLDLSKLKHAIKPLLWKVTKEGVTGDCWLFGTIHVADPRVTTLHPATARAFKNADRVYTEVDMSTKAQVQASEIYMRRDQKTMSQSIGPDLTEKVNAELQLVNQAYSIEAFNPMRTWMMVVILPQLKQQTEGRIPLDLQLWNKAAAAGKQTIALESAKEQMGGLNSLTEQEQITLLELTLSSLADAREQGIDPIKTIVDLYVEGDTKKMTTYFKKEMNDERLPKKIAEKFIQILLHDRNKRIAANIDKHIQTHSAKSHLFAVGAGHYLLDENIIQLLEKKGYKIELVTK